MAALKPIIIHLVHGTWPCGRGKMAQERWDKLRNGTPKLDANHFWFVKGSSFCEGIIKRSAGRSIDFVTFTWSGVNNFAARHKAATALRTQLEAELRKSSNACHVVVAHSHGGTVAFEAIANASPEWQQSLAGILTMGTPFVALRRESSINLARAAALPWAATLMLCIIVAVASVLFGPGGSQSFGATVALLIAIVCFYILAKESVDSLMRSKDLKDLLYEPQLECPLLAYRAPGDEASYVISAAQITDWLLGLIGRGMLSVRLNKSRAWKLVITTVTITSLAVMLWWLFTKELYPLWFYLIAGPVSLVLFSLVLLMVVPLILLPGMLALRLTTGGEAVWHAGYVTVDAESVPVGISANIEILRVPDNEWRTMPVRHSLHKLSVMQKQIGKWLQNLNLTAAERAVLYVFKKAGETSGEIIKIRLIQDKRCGLGYSIEQIDEAIESLIAEGWVERQPVSCVKLTQSGSDRLKANELGVWKVSPKAEE